MKLVKVVSKKSFHNIKIKCKENGKEVVKEKQVPNTYLFLELDSGVRVLISAVKVEDKRLLESHAVTQY